MKPQKIRLDKQQQKAIRQIKKKLKKYKLCILNGQARSRKTYPFLTVIAKYKRPLVITQKGALSGIIEASKNLKTLSPKVSIVNYHAMLKEDIAKLKPDVIVLDECHRWITAYPKVSVIWKAIKPFCLDIPIILSSGTLTPQSYAGLFNMLSLSSYTPWKRYKSFKEWFKDYGAPYTIKIRGLDIPQYNKIKENRINKVIPKYTVVMTRKKAGIKHEPIDTLVYIDMNSKQQKFYKKLDKDLVIPSQDILGDQPAKLNNKKHQISGGFVKREDGSIYTFKNNPKIEWLKDNCDPEKTIIVAHHKPEQEALADLFPNTGSITKLSEGQDFSNFDRMIVFSMSFSCATYQQIRVRQANVNRKNPIEILYLICGIDSYVYKAVQSNTNFTTNWYRKELKKDSK